MVATQAACTGRARLKVVHRSQGTRGAHVEQGLHGCDLGRVEAERLVERRRALPSRKAGIRRARRGAAREASRRWVAAAQATCTRRDRLEAVGGQGTRGAHGEHVAHLCDLGRVEAERLVERRRALEEHVAHVCDLGRVEAERLVERGRALRGRKARACGTRVTGGVRALGGGGASGTYGEGPTQGCGGPGHARSARRTCGTC